MYTVLTKAGKKAYRFSSKISANSYAKQIGGKVVTETSIQKNPIVSWQTKDDSEDYSIRLYRLQGYGQGTSSISKAFCREVLQNSVDAGATKVMFYFGKDQNNKQIIRSVDNGCGMSSKDVIPFMLTTGGTGKGKREEESSNTGGFGDAKNLILLPWRSWRVITSTGNGITTVCDCPQGGESKTINKQDLDKSTDWFLGDSHGTIIDILGWDQPSLWLTLQTFRSFIEICNLPGVSISLLRDNLEVDTGDFSFGRSNETLTTRSGCCSENPGSLYADGMATRDMFPANALLTIGKPKEFNGKIGFSDRTGKIRAKPYFKRHPARGLYSRLIYRTNNGISCWDEDLPSNCNGIAIIEFTARSTLVLTEKRNAIADDVLRNNINEWVTLLKQEPRLIVRAGGKLTQVFPGFGSLSAPASRVSESARMAILQSRQSTGISMNQVKEISEDAAKKIEKICSEKETLTPIVMLPAKAISRMIEFEVNSVTSKNKSESSAEKASAIESAVRRMLYIPDYCLHIETDFDLAGFKIPAKFKPDTMSKDVRILLSIWSEACRIVMMRKGCSKEYGVGFCFGGEVLGLAIQSAEVIGGKCSPFIFINPIGLSGSKSLIGVDSIESLKEIWAIAIHEVTHVVDSTYHHLEEFASALTTNIALCASSFPLFVEVASLSKISDKIAKDSFADDLDLSEFEEIEKGNRPKSKTEKILEQRLCQAIVESIRSGNEPPKIEGTDLSRMLTNRSKSDIVNATRYKTSTSVVSGHDQEMQKMVIDSLRAKLRAATEANSDLSKQIASLSEETMSSQKKSTKLFKLVSVSDISKRYKN